MPILGSSKEGESTNSKPTERESREARRERALREREQKVKFEQGKVNMSIEQTRTGVNLEEGEHLFKCVVYRLFHATVVSTPRSTYFPSSYYQDNARRCYSRPTGTAVTNP